MPTYKSFRLHKRVKHPAPPLPSSWQLTKRTFRLLQANRKNIIWFLAVYGLVYFVFVRGFSSPVDIENIRDSFEDVLSKDISNLAINISVLALMLESATSASGDVQGVYQSFFIVMATLALIWLFRQQQAGNKVTMKEAFYRGMYPIVPFILILFVIGLQIIPASIGNYLLRTVINNDLAITVGEQLAWLVLFILLVLLSAYWITGSIIALFISTLPEMTPMKSLRKARSLVQFRRLSIMKKFIGLFFTVVLLFVMVIFPSIFVSALLAQVLYFTITILFLPFLIGYVFILYRELL